MKNNKNIKARKKIKKLKKGNIWPSFILFVVSFFVTGISVSIFVSMFMYYMLQEKFDVALKNSEYIGSMIESKLAEGESYDQAFEFLMKDGKPTNSVAILDQDDHLLANVGDASYNLEKHGTLVLWNEYQLYQDQNSDGNIFNAQGELAIKLGDIVQCSMNGFGTDDKLWMDELIYEEPYWFAVSKESDTHCILIRNTFELYRKDIIFVSGMGIGLLMIVCLPLLFLFIHVISNINMQRRMYQLLNTDLATGGNNWFFFSNQAEKRLKMYRNAEKTYALVQLSYDKYRSYCACHSTEDDEMFLQQIDQYLERKLDKKEIYAHMTDAEFVLLLRCDSKERVAARIEYWFQEMTYVIPECLSEFHAGIFMIVSTDRGGKRHPVRRQNVDISKLYHNAGVAKDSIGETEDKVVQFFDENLLAQQMWEHHVEERMEYALHAEEFQVYLQPKYDPVTERLAGAEALVRWINDVDGFVPPGKFIPIFEKNGFIVKLDDYMILHVAELQAKWLKEGRKVVPVSVNVSRVHFSKPDLAEHICKLVDTYNLPHELLEIELTESAFFDDKESLLNTVHALKNYGFDISMDDFGAGYSSLNSLKELPLDVLKLDAEFFRGEFEKERGEIVVSEAIHMAKNLNMRIVAEGIEEKEQVDFLAKIGCDMIQGYYFAKPMSAEDYEKKM